MFSTVLVTISIIFFVSIDVISRYWVYRYSTCLLGMESQYQTGNRIIVGLRYVSHKNVMKIAITAMIIIIIIVIVTMMIVV